MNDLKLQIDESWLNVINDEFKADYFSQLSNFLDEENRSNTIYPPEEFLFSAFNRTPFESVKVVILGQDPYHGEGQAHGLCFSVPQGIKQPPSLKNIFKELHNDIGIDIPTHGNLEKWTDQGILLLNATLTVRANQAGSHHKKGWEKFTDAVIKKISDEKEGVIFILWGNYAQSKIKLIDSNRHHILTAVHPSPLAANRGGFFGCKHFSKTNEILIEQGLEPIDWQV